MKNNPISISGRGYTLLTGATGLVGRYLLRDLLMRGQRVAVLVRPSKRQTAQQRVAGICQRWEIGNLFLKIIHPSFYQNMIF